MAKLVITSGCSFTAGAELEDYVDNWEKGLEESKLVWSYKIKEKLWPDADFLNVSKSGGSNATITKKTLYYTNKMLEQYDPKDIVVLVMWTGVDRREWRLTNKNNLDYEMSDFKYENTTASDASILSKINVKNIMKEYYHPVWTNFRKKTLIENKLSSVILNYYRNFVNKESSLYDALKNIEYLSLFLENNNIPYYYTSSDRHIFDYSNDVLGRDMFIDRLIKKVNPIESFFSVNGTGFCEYTSDNEFPLCEFGHSGKEAHQEYANLMYKWIDK